MAPCLFGDSPDVAAEREQYAVACKQRAGDEALLVFLTSSPVTDDPALVKRLIELGAWAEWSWDMHNDSVEGICVKQNLPNTLRLLLKHLGHNNPLFVDSWAGLHLLNDAYLYGHDACALVLLDACPGFFKMPLVHPQYVHDMMLLRKRALHASVALYKALRAKGLERNLCVSLGRAVWAKRHDEEWSHAYGRSDGPSSWWCSLQ